MEWKYCYDCKYQNKKPNEKPCNNCMEDEVSNWEQGEIDVRAKEELEKVIKAVK